MMLPPPWDGARFPPDVMLGTVDGSKLTPFKNDGVHCVLRDLQCGRNVFKSNQISPYSEMLTYEPLTNNAV